jgi:twitching motility protein PilT
MNETINLNDLLEELVRQGGSDLHISTNTPPLIRVDGSLRPLEGFAPLSPEETRGIAYSVLSDLQRERFEKTLELDFSFQVTDLSRFRANIFDQRGGVGAVFRFIPFEPRPFEDLGLPPSVEQLCDLPRGLVLVTGPTGSGKSTTLAAMLDKINRERYQHILTIEDPIEFIHSHKNCLVNQREVNCNTNSFHDALRTALRQDPDVVLIGELRDLETIESALRIAETGHLTLATLHTNSAASTIIRIIDVFPAMQQAQIRTQLSQVLVGVLSQQLLPRATGQGRCMALEILLPTPAIRNLIRTDKVHQIYSQMVTGQEGHSMQTLNQSLAELYHNMEITMETALKCSSDQRELQELISIGPRNRSAINLASTGPGRQSGLLQQNL